MAANRRPDERLRDVSRRMILDRTAGLLVRQGYGATSLRDIAQACDMKAGSLYYHFESKDALVEEIMTEGVNRVEASVLKALEGAAGAPPLDRIRIAMEVHLKTLHDKSDYGSAHIRCFAHVPADIRNRLRSNRARYEEVWTRLLSEARAAGEIAGDIDLHTLKFAIIGMMNWTLEWRMPSGLRPEQMADQFFRVTFDGARPR
ncbi:TetR/AcrR family transcriptional regulator [Seohaeicola saemankumensis]|nr:TetR/AcrR family transcriptional regulator [Seohaeicola saemankumensis]MCA0871523.1 TetR/AcrR family transcriptional regulator [Seohaeicola saemankumensis]